MIGNATCATVRCSPTRLGRRVVCCLAALIPLMIGVFTWYGRVSNGSPVDAGSDMRADASRIAARSVAVCRLFCPTATLPSAPDYEGMLVERQIIRDVPEPARRLVEENPWWSVTIPDSSFPGNEFRMVWNG